MTGVDPSATFNSEKGVYEVPIDSMEIKKQFLCSCGESSKLPYCDGTHAKKAVMKPVQIQINKEKGVIEVRARQEVANAEAKKIFDENYKKRVLITTGTLVGAFLATRLFL